VPSDSLGTRSDPQNSIRESLGVPSDSLDASIVTAQCFDRCAPSTDRWARWTH
jgi:hypothetical protein